MRSGACAHSLLFICLKALLLQTIGTLVQIHILQRSHHHTTSLYVLLLQPFDGAYLLLVVYGVIQFVIGLRKLRLAAVLHGGNTIILAKD